MHTAQIHSSIFVPKNSIHICEKSSLSFRSRWKVLSNWWISVCMHANSNSNNWAYSRKVEGFPAFVLSSAVKAMLMSFHFTEWGEFEFESGHFCKRRKREIKAPTHFTSANCPTLHTVKPDWPCNWDGHTFFALSQTMRENLIKACLIV